MFRSSAEGIHMMRMVHIVYHPSHLHPFRPYFILSPLDPMLFSVLQTSCHLNSFRSHASSFLYTLCIFTYLCHISSSFLQTSVHSPGSSSFLYTLVHSFRPHIIFIPGLVQPFKHEVISNPKPADPYHLVPFPDLQIILSSPHPGTVGCKCDPQSILKSQSNYDNNFIRV